MPVSGKSSHHYSSSDIKLMEKAREFFAVGEQFWYSPLAEHTVEILVEPVKRPPEMYARGVCQQLCALCKWCGEKENYSGGVNYIPECKGDERVDNISVYFKEV